MKIRRTSRNECNTNKVSAGWKTSDVQNNLLTIDLSKEKAWTTIKQVIGRIKLWGRKR